MSVRIKHLNADTTFLITFSPSSAGDIPHENWPGSFSILFDPWLEGPSRIYHSKFAISHHLFPACISSLADIPEPDLVVISQEKSDHCHKDTLLQLSPHTSSLILGPQAAVRLIKKWNHFDPSLVQSLQRFDERRPETVYRIKIPPICPGGSDGEVTIAFIESRFDLTGLHNAIAVTYRPPSESRMDMNMSFVDLPLTPPSTPPGTSLKSGKSIASPTMPLATTISPSPLGSRERTVSVLYSPHGVNYELVKAYASTHLLAEAALPLTALLHSFHRVSNPWYFGGNICAGLPSGGVIAKNLYAKVWISAHDEEKPTSGVSVQQIKVTKFQHNELWNHVHEVESEKPRRKRELFTELVELSSGEEYFVPPRS